MSTQFARVESFGLNASKQAKTKKNKTTILGVCAEAARIEGYTGHVSNVEPADVIYGINPMDLYHQIEANFNSQNIIRKEKGGKSRQKDSLLMTAGVFSYPSEVIDDEFYRWQADCIEYLKKEYGDKFKSAVMHMDESHPHLHFFLCDLKTLRVDGGLDPAKTDQHKSRMLKDGSAIGQKQALEAFQNRFHESVGGRYGHARKNGSRARLHGAPAWIRSLLGGMAAINAEKVHLSDEKLRLEDEKLRQAETRARTQEQAKFLREKSRDVLELEKRFTAGLLKLTQYFDEQEAKQKALITAGKIGEAQAVRKAFEALRQEFSSDPAIASTLEKRTQKPSWFRSSF